MNFPTMVCSDYSDFDPEIDGQFEYCTTLCINDERNVFSFGYSDSYSHGHRVCSKPQITKIKQLSDIKMISCCCFYTVCLTISGDVYVFGTEDQLEENEINFSDAHIPRKIDIPPCKQISCGSNFCICLTDDNKLYSFGKNRNGQLGLGDNESHDLPQLIPGLNNVEFVECGDGHVICKTYNNEYYSWGGNYCGQLGQGNNDSCNKPIQCHDWPDDIISIKCGSYFSLLLTLEGKVYIIGNNKSGSYARIHGIERITTPKLVDDIPEIQRIECGYRHCMCIDIDNNLWVFGNNENGQLGLAENKETYIPILHPTLSNIIDISSGGNHTFVKTIEDKIFAFGRNSNSQLGTKVSQYSQKTPIQVLKGNEDKWCSFMGTSRQKSAKN